MKKLFFIVLGILTLASVVTVMTKPDRQTERPVIYWKSDANPQRYEQIELFHKWLVKTGHVNEKGDPVVELRLDAASSNQGNLIQAVSGLGGDIIDAKVEEFYPLGVLSPINEGAGKGNYSLTDTYQGLRQNLSVDGVQYAYPCNASVTGLWVNVGTFERYGMRPPPEIWTPDEFEEIGKKFVDLANKGRPRQEAFFCSGNQLSFITPIIRSEGLDLFNETLTRCIANDPRYVKMLKLLYKWTYVDHLFPSAAEVLSMNTTAGYGGGAFAQFQSGKFAMIVMGRYCLIRFREAKKPMKMCMCRFPEKDFQNMIIRVRSATLYRGSKNKEYAKLFFAFLADKEYNDYIIDKADGIPPNPKYAYNNPKYNTPANYPNEGNTHANELKWARTIALPDFYSPYFKVTGTDWIKYAYEKYFNNRCTAEEAARETQERINNAIMRTVSENKHYKEQYEKDCLIQKKIDKLKADGKKIPASLIRNPYYLAYYRSKGMLNEPKKERSK